MKATVFENYWILTCKIEWFNNARIVPNGETIVSIEIEGIYNDWKKVWTFNGIQILKN